MGVRVMKDDGVTRLPLAVSLTFMSKVALSSVNDDRFLLSATQHFCMMS